MNPETTIHPQFTASIAAGLAHWQNETVENTDAVLIRLDAQRHNLARLISYGLKLAQTQRAAAMVALQSFYLAERRGYWQEWIAMLQNAAASMSEDPVLQAELLYRLGELYRVSRQLPAAIETHRRAEAVAAQTEAAHLRHRIWFGLSTDYSQTRNYDLAEEYGEKALTGYRATNAPPEKQAAALNTLGIIAWGRGEMDAAAARLRQAAAIWRGANQPTELLRTLNNLMGALRAARKYEDVRACYEEAVACFPHTAGAFEQTVIEINYGGALFEQEQYEEAETVFLRANSVFLQQSTHFYYRAFVAQCLGNTLLKQERLAEAEAYLQEGARLWLQSDDELMRANTLGTIAEVYVRQGKRGEAVVLFDEALALLGRYPDDASAKRLTADFQRQRQELEFQSL
jgi:tetratricopeptide (TPR) repeat protein